VQAFGFAGFANYSQESFYKIEKEVNIATQTTLNNRVKDNREHLIQLHQKKFGEKHLDTETIMGSMINDTSAIENLANNTYDGSTDSGSSTDSDETVDSSEMENERVEDESSASEAHHPIQIIEDYPHCQINLLIHQALGKKIEAIEDSTPK
jgi:phosphoglycerol transferase MdoB-like AlkP superfamily enzyme